MKTTYEPPVLRIIGTVHEVTQQRFNKCGLTPDGVDIQGGVGVGEIVEVPPACPIP